MVLNMIFVSVKQVFNNGKSQIDPDVIPKIQTISVAKTDHVTLLVVIANNLFHVVDGFERVGIYWVTAPDLLS